MRLRNGLVAALAGTAALLLTVGCGAAASPEPTPPPESPAFSPTPVPPEARRTATEFARAHQAIEQDWDQFHRDFDQWRSGLVACERSSAEQALRGFRADFNEVLVQARGLPRATAVRALADQLISAAEEEGEALRQLRDRWQPADTALVAAYESKRQASAAAQQSVLDRISDLRAGVDPGSVEEARTFSSAFDSVSADWARFHTRYNEVRGQRNDLSATEMSSRLSDLVDQFAGIVSAVGNLPSSDTSRAMKEDLTAAAQAQDQGLKTLRDTYQARAEAAGSSNTEEPAAANNADPFAGMDNLVSRSNDTRQRVTNQVKELVEAATPQTPGDREVDTFRQRHDALARTWNNFHREYDQWRRTEGGCNRAEVIEQLGQFHLRFGEIAARVRNLPAASYVRPMEDTLVEAAQREEEALRVLRNTWRPFATDAYRALDHERSNANRLRRQAQVGTQELLDRFGIPQS